MVKYSKLPKIFNGKDYSYHYLQGVAYGDGYMHKNGRLILRVADKDFIENFIKQAKKLGFIPKHVKTKKENIYGAQICNMALIKKLKQDKISEISHGFVDGFIDSEAGVTNNGYRKEIRMFNTKENMLIKISSYLKKNKIKSRVRGQSPSKQAFGNKTLFILYVTGSENITKFYDNFHFSIKRKQDRLDAIVESYKK